MKKGCLGESQSNKRHLDRPKAEFPFQMAGIGDRRALGGSG